MQGKRVLMVDLDPQGHLTVSLGWLNKEGLQITLATHLERMLLDEPGNPEDGILQHNEGIDLMPANRKLSAVEMSLVNAISREVVLKSYLNALSEFYDYIILDCPASLSMLTINALVAANSVIIPSQTQFLSANGMTDLMSIISRIKKQLNPTLKVSGILLTLVDRRTNLAKVTEETLRREYGNIVKIYNSCIPMSIKLAETTTCGMSIFEYSGTSAAAKAYAAFTNEVLADEEGY
jgi:chromosome partitioning protein